MFRRREKKIRYCHFAGLYRCCTTKLEVSFYSFCADFSRIPKLVFEKVLRRSLEPLNVAGAVTTYVILLGLVLLH